MANSGEGSDRATLELTNSWGGKGPTMTPLIEATAAACKQTVVVMVSSGAVLTPWRDRVEGIVAAVMPGQEYGRALADVLFGDVPRCLRKREDPPPPPAPFLGARYCVLCGWSISFTFVLRLSEHILLLLM
jgi:hypothetical protein